MELNFVDIRAELVGMIRKSRRLRQKTKKDREPMLVDPEVCSQQ
jgi:hypothetical protein